MANQAKIRNADRLEVLNVALGGTGDATLTTGNLLVGAGTSPVTFIAPSTSGNVLTSNGSVWQSTAPAGGSPTCVTSIPIPVGSGFSAMGTTQATANTVMNVGQVIIPFGITANKISIRTGTDVSVAGTYDLSLYSEDGQTRLFSVTTASMSVANVIVTTALSAVVIPAGVYYIAFNSNTTADVSLFSYTNGQVPFTDNEGLPEDVASEPVMFGTVTITASTPPTTITPASITQVISRTLCFRLDN